MSAAQEVGLSTIQVPAQFAPLVRDFRGFCALLQIVDFETKEVRPFELSPLQNSFCRARTGWDFVLKFRKAYVSTLELAYDLWWFLTVEGAKVLIVCQAERDHGTKREFDRIIRIFIKSLRGLGFVIPLDVEAEGRWALNARAATMQIIEAGASYATAQKTGRGGAVNRLHFSEVASFKYGTDVYKRQQCGSAPGPPRQVRSGSGTNQRKHAENATGRPGSSTTGSGGSCSSYGQGSTLPSGSSRSRGQLRIA